MKTECLTCTDRDDFLACELCKSEEDKQQYKRDAGKVQISLVPPEMVRAAARVRTWAVENKYPDPDGWRKVQYRQYKDALLRHVLQWWENDGAIDAESKLDTFDHICCNIAFLAEMRKEMKK